MGHCRRGPTETRLGAGGLPWQHYLPCHPRGRESVEADKVSETPPRPRPLAPPPSRVGSQFRLQFAPSPEPALQTYSLVNGSLLFQSSPRTAFLLGGWPLGSEVRGHDPRSLISELSLPQLGSEVRPLPLDELGGFEGQIQLALFNGGPWGLWNVRSTSPTDLIGDVEFRRFHC